MIQYDLKDRDPESETVLVFIICVLGVEIAALCAIYLGLNLVSAIILGFIILTVILVMLKAIENKSYTTVTYLDEEDVERIRAQLNATEKEESA